jgi:putative phosphonate metabolism protein
MDAEQARYAVYYAPEPDSPLWRFGCRWLGYDPECSIDYPPEPLPGFDAAWLAAITAGPRRYGFHATLKPPFALRQGMTPGQLIAAVARFSAARPVVVAPPLGLVVLDRFLALRPAGVCPALDGLAAACVRELDAFRAPAPEAELARRRRAGLTLRQERLLVSWGYPYVMEEFRFHLTLTGRLDEASREQLRLTLAPVVAPLCREPLAITGLALYQQPDRSSPFELLERFPLVPEPAAAARAR